MQMAWRQNTTHDCVSGFFNLKTDWTGFSLSRWTGLADCLSVWLAGRPAIYLRPPCCFVVESWLGHHLCCNSACLLAMVPGLMRRGFAGQCLPPSLMDDGVPQQQPHPPEAVLNCKEFTSMGFTSRPHCYYPSWIHPNSLDRGGTENTLRFCFAVPDIDGVEQMTWVMLNFAELEPKRFMGFVMVW